MTIWYFILNIYFRLLSKHFANIWAASRVNALNGEEIWALENYHRWAQKHSSNIVCDRSEAREGCSPSVSIFDDTFFCCQRDPPSVLVRKVHFMADELNLSVKRSVGHAQFGHIATWIYRERRTSHENYLHNSLIFDALTAHFSLSLL